MSPLPKKKTITPWRTSMLPAPKRKKLAKAVKDAREALTLDDERRLEADPSTPLRVSAEVLEQLRAAEAAFHSKLGLEREPELLPPEVAVTHQDLEFVGDMAGGIAEWMKLFPERIHPDLKAKLGAKNGIQVKAAEYVPPKPKTVLAILGQR